MNRHRILIADPVNRDLWATCFANGTYQPIFAGDGMTAMKMACDFDPDLIILELLMPGKDGLEVCRLLRGDRQRGAVPIFLSTDLTDLSTRLMGLDSGADDVFVRPFDIKLIQARVGTQIKLNRYRHLLHERKRHQRCIDFLPMAMVVLDSHGREKSGSLAWRRLKQDLTPADRGGPLGGMIASEDGPRFAAMFAHVAKQPGHIHKDHFACKKNDGSTVWWEVLLCRRSDDPTDPAEEAEFCAVFRDRTPERNLENRLLRQFRPPFLLHLSSELCREMAAMLHSIQTASEYALAFLPAEESTRKDIETIRQTVDEGLAMQNRFQEFAKHADSSPRVTHLNRAIESTVSLLQTALPTHRHCHLELGAEVGQVRLDQNQLIMALWDLLEDARQAMTTGFDLTFRTRPSPLHPRKPPGENREFYRFSLIIQGHANGHGPVGQAALRAVPRVGTGQNNEGWESIQALMSRHNGSWSATRGNQPGLEIHLDFPQALPVDHDWVETANLLENLPNPKVQGAAPPLSPDWIPGDGSK